MTTEKRDAKNSTAKMAHAGILPGDNKSGPSPGETVDLSRTDSSWVQQDKMRAQQILAAFWKKFLDPDHPQETDFSKRFSSLDQFKIFIINNLFRPPKQENRAEIERLFKEAQAPDGCEKFCVAMLQRLSPRLIFDMNDGEKLIPSENRVETPRPLGKEDLANLTEYMREEKISAQLSLRANAGELIPAEFPENQGAPSSAIHSVGKIFTGVLAVKMIQKGLVDPTKPLDEDFIQTLPPKLRAHLKENAVTLHQLMTHYGGVGDYLQAYQKAIFEANQSSTKVPEIKNIEDFLKYAEEKTYSAGEKHYSNLGMVLVGLALEHAYNKKHPEAPRRYDEILREEIIVPAQLTHFSITMPKNAKYNREDAIAPHIAGGPGGGYWTTAEDLAKFGKWIFEQCAADPKLKDVMEKYGQEFYYPDRQAVEHGGFIPSASAFLFVSLRTGAVAAILSDQGIFGSKVVAEALGNKVKTYLFSAPAPTAVESAAPPQSIEIGPPRGKIP